MVETVWTPESNFYLRFNNSITMKLRHAINAHKGSTFVVVLLGMQYFDNCSLGPWIYLALHGCYGLLWLR